MGEIIKTIFTVPDSYKEKIAEYKKVDAAMAMGVFLLYCMAMVFLGLIADYVSGLMITVTGATVNLIFVGIVIAFLNIRKQGLETIGLKGGNMQMSLIFGAILSAFLFFCNCLSNVLFAGMQFIPLLDILINFFYYFTVALCEEVIFRGYIGTRLHGIFKNMWVVVFITGILFVLMHFPFRMVAYQMTFMELATNYPYMLDLFITHLILSYIHMKSDSLTGAILPHWVSNLSHSIVTYL